MFKPSLEEFKKLSESGNLIPVYKEILADLDTPVSAYMKISDGEDYSFLLESVEGGEKWARYCFLGCDPAVVVSSKGRDITIEENGERKEQKIESGNPLSAIKIRDHRDGSKCSQTNRRHASWKSNRQTFSFL